MGQTIETVDRATDDVSRFYGHLAPEYDGMTGFAKRFVHEKPFFRLLVDNYNIHTALDAGAGTGFHSLLLAQLGVDVTAVDIALEMLQRVDEHSLQMGLHVKTQRAGFHELAQELPSEYDGVFCMGNGLAHDLTHESLLQTIQQFAVMLRPGGILFAQVVNYERILAQRERIQNVKEQDDVTFVRFYDFEERFIRFNLLRLRRIGGRIVSDLDSIQLHLVMSAELIDALKHAGFENIKLFGGISMEAFVPDSSRDLVVLAQRKIS